MDEIDLTDRSQRHFFIRFCFILGLVLGCIEGCIVGYTASYLVAHAQEPVGCPQVCPACNVEAEWTDEGYQYEYTDNTAVVTGTTPISVCWKASGSYGIASVCIKTGQDLFWPKPSDGCWQTPRQDISHIVVCTEKATAIGLVSFQASAIPDLGLVLFLVAVAAMAFGLCIIIKAGRGQNG